MMEYKLVLFNGPAECGKNSVIDALSYDMTLTHRRCKDHLFVLVRSLFCLSQNRFNQLYFDRVMKEKPVPEFRLSWYEFENLHKIIPEVKYELQRDGYVFISIRSALIYTSEVICKPAFGQDYFGVARAKSLAIDLELSDDWTWVDDSCGFDDEIIPSLELLGQENVMLLRIHGRGQFDATDSRKYISDGVVNNTIDVYNDGLENDYIALVTKIMVDFLKD